MAQTIAASEFKSTCLAVLDTVAETAEEFVITKRGVPVARLVPILPEPKSLLGSVSYDTDEDLLSPVDVEWEANQ